MRVHVRLDSAAAQTCTEPCAALQTSMRRSSFRSSDISHVRFEMVVNCVAKLDSGHFILAVFRH